MLPSEYAALYFPITVPGTVPTQVNISKYHLGLDAPNKDAITGALADHFITQQRKDKLIGWR